MRAGAAALALGIAAFVGSPAIAGADTSTAQGWWAQTGSLPTNPAASDVPKDGLLVQGGPSAPAAFAALAATGVPAAAKITMTLHVASGSATTPGAKLSLCPLVGSFSPAQGGPIGDAPRYSCAKTLTSAENASAFTFDVTPLVSAGSLLVAILPGDAATRAVLAKPGGNTFALQQPAVPSTAPSAAPVRASSRATKRATPSAAPTTAPASAVPSTSAPAAADVGAVLTPPDLPAATEVAAGAPAPVVAAEPPAPTSIDTPSAEPVASDQLAAPSPTVVVSSRHAGDAPRVAVGLAIAALMLVLTTWAFVGQAAPPVDPEGAGRPRREVAE